MGHQAAHCLKPHKSDRGALVARASGWLAVAPRHCSGFTASLSASLWGFLLCLGVRDARSSSALQISLDLPGLGEKVRHLRILRFDLSVWTSCKPEVSNLA